MERTANRFVRVFRVDLSDLKISMPLYRTAKDILDRY